MTTLGATVALEDFCDHCGQRNPGEGQMGTACPTCGDAPCQQPCDTDCEIAPVHCINYHLPRHKWTHPEGAACA